MRLTLLLRRRPIVLLSRRPLSRPILRLRLLLLLLMLLLMLLMLLVVR